MSEDSFLREVEDELRSEKLRAFWRRFAPFVIGAAVLIVLAVGGNEIWNWWRTNQAAEASESFYAAQELSESGDTDAALDAFRAIAADGPDGYATLARFREAGILAETGDTEGAVSLYDGLASTAPDPGLRELALVLAAYLLVDGADVPAVQTRVSGLLESGSALAPAAREALGLTQYAAGDYETARATFETLAAGAGADQDLQGRALLYLEVIASETGEDLDVPADTGLEDLGIEGTGVQGVDAGLADPLEPAATETEEQDAVSGEVGLDEAPTEDQGDIAPAADPAPLEPVAP